MILQLHASFHEEVVSQYQNLSESIHNDDSLSWENMHSTNLVIKSQSMFRPLFKSNMNVISFEKTISKYKRNYYICTYYPPHVV